MIPKEDDEQKALDQAHGFWIKFWTIQPSHTGQLSVLSY